MYLTCCPCGSKSLNSLCVVVVKKALHIFVLDLIGDGLDYGGYSGQIPPPPTNTMAPITTLIPKHGGTASPKHDGTPSQQLSPKHGTHRASSTG